MADSTMVLRVDDQLKAAFAQAAKAADRTASQLLRDFMRDYVREQAEYDAWLRGKVAAARSDAASGLLYPSEEVEGYFTERRAAGGAG
jgi:predicted transcriptional regulator